MIVVFVNYVLNFNNGKEINKFFGKISCEAYLASIKRDVREAQEEKIWRLI